MVWTRLRPLVTTLALGLVATLAAYGFLLAIDSARVPGWFALGVPAVLFFLYGLFAPRPWFAPVVTGLSVAALSTMLPALGLDACWGRASCEGPLGLGALFFVWAVFAVAPAVIGALAASPRRERADASPSAHA